MWQWGPPCPHHPGWQQAGLLSWGTRRARQTWGASQAGLPFGPWGASLTHGPRGPGESRFALWAGRSRWPRPPRWPQGTGVSLGSTLSPGAGLPKAALCTLEAREAFQAQGTPFTLWTGGSLGASRSLGSRQAQAAHVALLSFHSWEALDTHVTLEATRTWEAWNTWVGRGGGQWGAERDRTPKQGEREVPEPCRSC